MSTFNEIDISCPNCGHEYKGVVWTAIHSAQDPELKDLLLGGEINLLMCPDCAHVAFQDHFILYQDPAAELIAYIYPHAQQADEEFLRAATSVIARRSRKASFIAAPITTCPCSQRRLISSITRLTSTIVKSGPPIRLTSTASDSASIWPPSSIG